MRVVCLGGQFHELTIDLSDEQDVFQPTAKLRPRYVKLYEAPDGSQAYFASSELSGAEARHLVKQYLRDTPGRSNQPALE